MIRGARYIHTNLIARDWRALAAFYRSVFGCVDVLPERDFAAHEVEAGTAVPGAALRGMHMRLPGWGADGPTLEIFNYSQLADADAPVANRPGFAHIAFAVESVDDARAEVLSHGGRAVGDIVTVAVSRGTVTWCYVTDPEGNIIELQTRM
jgi:predicted enzyme related to lactoylglutathione lyase